MNANELTRIDQLCAFLAGTQRVAFEVAGDKQSRYDWLRRTLVKFDYLGCNKADKGTLMRYLMKVSGPVRSSAKWRMSAWPGSRTGGRRGRRGSAAGGPLPAAP